jgi:hypothetical protein
MKLKSLIYLTVLILLIGVSIPFFWGIRDRQPKYRVSTDGIDIPTFSAIEIDFEHQHDDTVSLPFTAGAIIDIDNDGTEELFLGGGAGQPDVLLRFTDNRFVDISSQAQLVKQSQEATFSSVVLDVDNNGFSDLIISRETGIWLYRNQNGHFSNQRLRTPIPENTSPLSIAIADINRDGYFDMYVCGYIKKPLVQGQTIFNDDTYGGASALLVNNGDNSFSNITQASGLEYLHNTFQAVFTDLDNDYLEDLVVAHDTGQVRMWKNLGNTKFKNMPNPNSKQYSYPMGIAVSDYNNDGLIDLFFSNVGGTSPEFLLRGDLRSDQYLNPKWMLFQNQGNFQFVDVAESAQLADYEFSWGAVFEDLNLDGRDDLVVAENYVSWPLHKMAFLRLPGRTLVQNRQGQFAEIGSESGITNKRFGITPLSADFNQDGNPDIVFVNLAGKSQAFLSRKGPNNYLKVKLPDVVSSIGASVTVTTSSGDKLHQTFIIGEGLCSDQSHILLFGLGADKATNVTVSYLNKVNKMMTGEFFNTLVTF